MGFIPNSAFSAAPDFSQQQQMMAMQQMMGGAFPMPWMMDMSGGGGYDPTESRMDMSRGMRPIITEAKDVTPSNTLNPNAIPFPPPQPLTDTATQGPAPIPAHIRQFPPRDPPSHTDGPFHAGQRGVYNPGAFKRDGPPHMAPRQGDTTMQDPPPPPQQLRLEPTPLPDKPLWTQPQRHQAANYKASHQDKTLVVEKIPADHLSLGAITTFFQKFGPVSNVAVDNRSYKALVTFEQHNDALAAHRTQEAIFGNRFVRVYWHRPLEGQGAVGQKALAASVDLVKNMANRQPSTPGATAIGLPTSPHPPSTPTKLSKAASALAAKTAFIDDLVTEQKILLKKIDEAKDPNMRKEYFTLLKRIQQQMTNAQTIEIASNKVQSRDQTPGPTLDERQQRVKEKLDKELEMHQVKVEQESSAPKEDAGAEDDPEVLLAKLTSLQQAVRNISNFHLSNFLSHVLFTGERTRLYRFHSVLI
jgi:RNA-binding protein 26